MPTAAKSATNACHDPTGPLTCASMTVMTKACKSLQKPQAFTVPSRQAYCPAWRRKRQGRPRPVPFRASPSHPCPWNRPRLFSVPFLNRSFCSPTGAGSAAHTSHAMERLPALCRKKHIVVGKQHDYRKLYRPRSRQCGLSASQQPFLYRQTHSRPRTL